jgi:hypothetical protein
MNPSNLKALDSKAANRAVADSTAVVANRKIAINRNVNANSASARNTLAEARGAVAVKNVAAANKAVVSKAADDKPSGGSQGAWWLCLGLTNGGRREATPAAFLVRVRTPKFGVSSAAFILVNPHDHLKIAAKLANHMRNLIAS